VGTRQFSLYGSDAPSFLVNKALTPITNANMDIVQALRQADEALTQDIEKQLPKAGN
jgi:hypothetical protein